MLTRVRSWPWPEIAILLLAAVLRFVALDIKPPHFDEGVNGWFADQMSRTGYYDYDPTNYHGPLHMYAVFTSLKLFGRDVVALRLPAILASLAAVWLTLRFARFFGTTTVRWAAVAMAVSPACVFYGRYSIHESWLVAFLLLTAWGLLELWKNGTRAGVFAIAGGIAGMILTKETYFIHLGCFLLAIPCLLLWQRLVPDRPPQPIARQLWSARDVAWSTAAAVFVIIFFYSGTFLNWKGVTGLWETYAAWGKTGVESNGHAKTDYDLFPLLKHGDKTVLMLNWYWVKLMAIYEWPALLGLLACFRLLWPAPPMLRYVAIAGAGTLLAYAIIPYKTPWLVLVMLWPFYFTFGAVMAEFARFAVVPLVGALAITLSFMRTLQLNFRDFANPKEPYVYVQTFPEIHRFTDPLLELARRNPANYQLRGDLMLGSYYPLPWMLGDFTQVGYHRDEAWPATLDGDFLAAEKSKADRVEARLRDAYYRREFRLRDAQEDCVAWFRVSTFRELLDGEPIVGPRRSAP